MRAADKAALKIATILAGVKDGVRPEIIAEQLGMKPKSISEMCRTGGRPDLAGYFMASPRLRARLTRRLLEDVEFMAGAGEWPGRICTRLHIKPLALIRKLEREGRQDLVDVIARAAYQQRAAA